MFQYLKKIVKSDTFIIFGSTFAMASFTIGGLELGIEPYRNWKSARKPIEITNSKIKFLEESLNFQIDVGKHVYYFCFYETISAFFTLTFPISIPSIIFYNKLHSKK